MGMILACGGAILAYIRKLIARFDKLEKEIPKKKVAIPLALSVEQNKKISILLDRIQVKYNGLRVHLTRISNGEEFEGGGSLRRQTRVLEVSREGCPGQTVVFQGLCLDTLYEELILVFKEGPAFTVVEGMEKSRFKEICIAGGTKAMVRCAMYAPGISQPVGFVGVDFDELSTGRGVECPPDAAEICKATLKISDILFPA